MIVANSQAYSNYEAPNLQNIEFYNDTTGNVIPSWLESGNSNTATRTVYWLRIDYLMPVGSTILVDMGFASRSVTLFNPSNTGEAPQLSSVYGVYDDGRTVFPFYDNFAGTTLSALWNHNGLVVVNDGVTIRAQAGAPYQNSNLVWTTNGAAVLAVPRTVDFYANADAGNTGKTAVGFGFEDTLPTDYSQGNGGGFQGGSDSPEVWDVVTVNQGSHTQTPVSSAGLPPVNQFQIYTVVATSSEFNYSVNYQPVNPPSLSSSVPTFSSKIGVFLSNHYQPTDVKAYWVRTRGGPPPCGGNPTITFLPPVIVQGPSSSTVVVVLVLILMIVVVGVVIVLRPHRLRGGGT